MRIYIGGEDEVTRAVARRIARYCHGNDIEFIDPAKQYNGTKALSKIPEYVKLGENKSVICVYDADNKCVVEVLKH